MVRKKKTMTCTCHEGHAPFVIGIALLIISGMLYLGYGWIEAFGVLGILAIIKGIYLMKK